MVDSFETPIARPSLPGVQKKFYSGKKKCHTVKTQIVTDKRGEVIALEPGYPGPLPDKTLYQESRAAREYLQAARRGDLRYLGVPEILLPHKKKRGKKGEKVKDLTLEQKAENQHGARVYVEHGIRRVKAWRILRDEFRLGVSLFSLVASATVGLVHLARLCPG